MSTGRYLARDEVLFNRIWSLGHIRSLEGEQHRGTNVETGMASEGEFERLERMNFRRAMHSCLAQGSLLCFKATTRQKKSRPKAAQV